MSTRAPSPAGTYSFYPLVVAFIAFTVLICVAGIRSASGVLLVPLEDSMGWSAASISVAVAINVAFYGAVGPFGAAMMDAFGVRRMTLTSLAVLGASTALSGLVQTPVQLALTWGIGVGLGIGCISMVYGTIIATRWFAKWRGFVYGALTGATAAGQLIFIPLLAWIAQSHGWRVVGFACALVALAAMIPVAFFMRDRPESIGLRRFGDDAETAAPAPQRNTNPLANTFGVLRNALRQRDFLLVAGTFFICGATTNGYIGTHFLAICGDYGLTQVHAAGLSAGIGVFSMVGSTAAGWLSDRYPARYLLFVFYGLRALSLFILPFAFAGANQELMLPAFMVFYGLDWLATGPPNMRALSEVLPREEVPIAFGWVAVAHQLGAGISTLVAGIVRSNTGSYVPTFDLYGAACVLAALAALTIGMRRRAVNRESRPAVLQSAG